MFKLFKKKPAKKEYVHSWAFRSMTTGSELRRLAERSYYMGVTGVRHREWGEWANAVIEKQMEHLKKLDNNAK